MSSPRILVLRAPGTNCDEETAFAFDKAGGKSILIHINQLLLTPRLVQDFQILCLPGGFSYGDDIAAGRILANQIRHHLFDVLTEFKLQGKLILGICNGFQILIKSGLLLSDIPEGMPATVTWNEVGRYQDRWVDLCVMQNNCIFLSGIERMYLPIAHAEGKFVTRDAATLDRLDRSGQLPLRYVHTGGYQSSVLPFPRNPNGSQANVAGVCDETGRVFGLMPHPERHIDGTQHPRWTRRPAIEVGDGFAVFSNAVQYFG